VVAGSAGLWPWGERGRQLRGSTRLGLEAQGLHYLPNLGAVQAYVYRGWSRRGLVRERRF